MCYQRTFSVEDVSAEVEQHFAAADYWCQVFVNGECVTEHEGGCMPFRIAVNDYVHVCENLLTMRVYDPVQTAITIPRWIERQVDSGQPPFNAETIPHGKQTWYIDASDFWQDVTLTTVPACYIDQVRVTPDTMLGPLPYFLEQVNNPSGELDRVVLHHKAITRLGLSDPDPKESRHGHETLSP